MSDVPDGGVYCLRRNRYSAIANGGLTTPVEASHLVICHWCRYLATKNDLHCLRFSAIIELSVGRKPSRHEKCHLAECPACKWFIQQLKEK